MVVSRRKRGAGKGKTSVFSEKKVKMIFDISVLDLMCSYIISNNSNIKKSHIVNMRNLFDSLDLDEYSRDIEKLKRIAFIRRGIEARLEKDLKNSNLILTYISGGETNPEVDIDTLQELSNSELVYINEIVSGALKCTFIESNMDTFFDLYSRYKSQDYRYRSEMVDEISEFVKKFNTEIRHTAVEGMTNTVFSLDDSFESKISDIHDTLTASNRFLYSGMQGFNMLVGGALEATRTYLLLGCAGIGKSMLLLNLALQIKKYNRNYKTKDPTKIPTVLFLTQENTIEETVDRICDMISGHNMKDFSKDEVIQLLRQDGELNLEGDNNINIHIMWRPDRGIDTSDLYGIIEDLEDDGYEVIALIQDHIKRIRSAYSSDFKGDLRLELGAVVNEFKILAQLKEIPIITVSHLNRDASAKIENASIGGKTDLTRLLGRSNVGESLLMLDNADCVIIANKDYDEDGLPYLCLLLEKIRNATPKLDYVCQPFAKGSNTKLIDDLFMQTPVYRESLKPQNQMAMATNINGALIKKDSYTNMDKIARDEESNMFEPLLLNGSGTRYSSNLNEMIENVPIDGEEENIPSIYQSSVVINVNPMEIADSIDNDEEEIVEKQPLIEMI